MTDAEILGRHQARLSSFVYRARRIKAHSLNEDQSALIALAEGHVEIRRYPDGHAEWVTRLPDEERLESAAARVRPLLLKQDPVYFSKVLGALSYVIRDEESPLWVDLALIKERWLRADRGFTGAQQLDENNINVALSAKELSDGWFYGDLVHADHDVRRKMAGTDFQMRFQAAAQLVAWLMVQSNRALELTVKCVEQGMIELPDEAFDETVQARTGTLTDFCKVAIQQRTEDEHGGAITTLINLG